MLYLQIILVSLFSLLILNFITKKKNFLITRIRTPHQQLAGTSNIPQVGGLILMINILFLYNAFSLNELFFYILILIIGILSDVDIVSSPIKRLSFQIIIVLGFVYLSDLYIDDLRVEFLNKIFFYNEIKYIFITFCFLILINGANFIDGCDGLSIGYFLIALVVILITVNRYDLIFDQTKMNIIILTALILFILNLARLIYLGDSGAYLLAFVVGVISINFYMTNKHISPYFIAILLWYPSFENLFSIIRKKIQKINAMNPDTYHFHQLLYKFLKTKIKKFCNPLSSMIILIYNFSTSYFSIRFYTETKILILFLLMNVIVYLIFYKILNNYLKNNLQE